MALAGELGAITIATNMAGRGTDIKLAPGVDALGGLYVIMTELHEAARIDRQLAGRCARQGDPGSHEAILSLEALSEKGGLSCRFLRLIQPVKSPLWNKVAKYALIWQQKKLERFHGRMRRELFKQDIQRKNLMSFSHREE